VGDTDYTYTYLYSLGAVERAEILPQPPPLLCTVRSIARIDRQMMSRPGRGTEDVGEAVDREATAEEGECRVRNRPCPPPSTCRCEDVRVQPECEGAGGGDGAEEHVLPVDLGDLFHDAIRDLLLRVGLTDGDEAVADRSGEGEFSCVAAHC
jgi:hypothetical protein